MEYYSEFIQFLNHEDKNRSVSYALDLLEKKKIDVVTLYEQVLTPALNQINCPNDKTNIWQEHIRSAIVRTIVESSFQYVLKELKESDHEINDKKVLVACPKEEFHEIGARMVTDYFTLAGCNALFIGANTPNEEIISAMTFYAPQYIALSVSDYYNLVEIKNLVEKINNLFPQVQIILGGNAVKKDVNIEEVQNKSVIIASSYHDILELVKEG